MAWKDVSHPNVLPLLGVSEKLFLFCIISPWLPNGHIIEYTRKNRQVNRWQLVSDSAVYTGILSETLSSIACASRLWPRISPFTEYCAQRYQPGER